MAGRTTEYSACLALRNARTTSFKVWVLVHMILNVLRGENLKRMFTVQFEIKKKTQPTHFVLVD